MITIFILNGVVLLFVSLFMHLTYLSKNNLETIKKLQDEIAEITELRSMAADWQRQFHTLRDRVEKLGFVVYYDDKGDPAVRLK